MGKLVATEFVSLDGVFEAPGGGEEFEHAGWTFTFDRGDDGNAFKLDELMAADAQLLGRITYEGFARAWPSIQDDVGFADKMNNMPKYVVSTTLASADWNNSVVIKQNVAEQVARLKATYEGDILIAGSGQLVRALMNDNLIDEYRLMLFPVVLGAGRRLFAQGSPKTTLKLIRSQPVGPDGVTVLTYTPISSTPSAS